MGDEDYEEEFEDYSGSEEGDKHPQTELQASVRNLKLGPQMKTTVGRDPTLSALPEEVVEALPAPVEATGSGTRIGAKADSLRSYLCGQVPEDAFNRAYALVRASGEVSTEELQQRVGEVIGAEKISELFTLFQLLCFLEDVAANSVD